MNNTKEEGKKTTELKKLQPQGIVSPFERFDVLSDSGFFKEMDRFFHEYLPFRWGRQFHLGWPTRSTMLEPFEGKTPRVDILDREEDFLIKAELPGVDKKDINITFSNNMVTLKANMRKEEKEEKDEYYRQEICSGVYMRSIDLPVPVKEDAAKATFKNGILELKIPKTERTKRTKIKVE